MSVENTARISTAQSAIQAGEKERALQLLRQAAQEDPENPRPWLQMIYAAPSKKEAREYLKQAAQRNAKPVYVAQAQNWIEDFYGSELIENTPPTQGLLTRIRDALVRSPKLIALVYLALLAQAEANTTIETPQVGMLLHGVSLVLLLVHATIISDRNERHFLLALSMAPLIRLVSLTLPLTPFPIMYWYALVGAPLFLATYFLARLTGVTPKKIGLTPRKGGLQALIGLSGVLLGYVEYLILRPEPLVAEFRFDQIILPAMILLIFTGFLEELIFRGIFQYFAIRHIGRLGLYYVAFIFAVFHLGYQSVLDFVFVFVVALIFSYAVQKTNSILGVTVAHGLTNIGLFLIFPFIFH